jgi:sulfur-oxidizing protein SoxY
MNTAGGSVDELSNATREAGRRGLLRVAGAAFAAGLVTGGGARAQGIAADPFEGDPYKSHPWPDMRREFLGRAARVVFDARVQVQGPSFAEDPMNVPISVRVDPALGKVEEIVVLVDRNPIRKVLSYEPVLALPAVAFRFKLEQASPVRAAVRLAAAGASGGASGGGTGRWVVGGAWVDSAGGGCTVSGATRKDGSWAKTLGDVSGKLFTPAPGQAAYAARLRVKVMHPMDTGLVAGIPAFYLNRLSLRDGDDRELARLQGFEPLSENPVFSFDFGEAPKGGVHIVGSDNNGNRIRSRVQ